MVEDLMFIVASLKEELLRNNRHLTVRLGGRLLQNGSDYCIDCIKDPKYSKKRFQFKTFCDDFDRCKECHVFLSYYMGLTDINKYKNEIKLAIDDSSCEGKYIRLLRVIANIEYYISINYVPTVLANIAIELGKVINPNFPWDLVI